MKYYAKCSTEDGNVILAMSAETKEQAIRNLKRTYNIIEVLDIKDQSEHEFISQREQFKYVPKTYRKENKTVSSGNFN